MLCLDPAEREKLQALYQRGLANGVEGLELVEGEALHRMEPALSQQAVAALYAPTSAILCPFGLTIALAENAAANGTEFRFDTQVQHIRREGDHFVVETGCGPMESRAVVNAAGVWGDVLHNQLCGDPSGSPPPGRILPAGPEGRRSGEPYRLSAARCHGQGCAGDPHCPRKPPPRPHCHGSAGPGRHCYHPDGPGSRHRHGGPQRAEPAHAGRHYQLRRPAGPSGGWQRRLLYPGEQRELLRGHRHRVPGLSSAPAIGVYVAGLVAEKLGLAEKPDFIAQRRDIVHVRELPLSERQALVERDPAYGNILCRCEQISEGEIRDAIRRSPGARSLDGVKRRVRAGMGRCQGGFCAPVSWSCCPRSWEFPRHS